MISEYRNKAKSAALVTVASVLAAVLWIALADHEELSREGGALLLLGPLLSLAGGVAFVIACWFYIKAKSRSGWWILLLLFSIFGLIVIALLEDRANRSHVKSGTVSPIPPDLTMRKRRIAIVCSLVWLLLTFVAAVLVGDEGRRFDFVIFSMLFLLVGVLPLVIIWGILWIRSAGTQK